MLNGVKRILGNGLRGGLRRQIASRRMLPTFVVASSFFSAAMLVAAFANIRLSEKNEESAESDPAILLPSKPMIPEMELCIENPNDLLRLEDEQLLSIGSIEIDLNTFFQSDLNPQIVEKFCNALQKCKNIQSTKLLLGRPLRDFSDYHSVLNAVKLLTPHLTIHLYLNYAVWEEAEYCVWVKAFLSQCKNLKKLILEGRGQSEIGDKLLRQGIESCSPEGICIDWSLLDLLQSTGQLNQSLKFLNIFSRFGHHRLNRTDFYNLCHALRGLTSLERLEFNAEIPHWVTKKEFQMLSQALKHCENLRVLKLPWGFDYPTQFIADVIASNKELYALLNLWRDLSPQHSNILKIRYLKAIEEHQQEIAAFQGMHVEVPFSRDIWNLITRYSPANPIIPFLPENTGYTLTDAEKSNPTKAIDGIVASNKSLIFSKLPTGMQNLWGHNALREEAEYQKCKKRENRL